MVPIRGDREAISLAEDVRGKGFVRHAGRNRSTVAHHDDPIRDGGGPRKIVSDHDAAVVVSDARADHVNESVRSVVLSALVNAAPTETKVKNRSYIK